jgi:hypothetical protein
MFWKKNELHTIHDGKPLFMGFVYAVTLRDDEWYAIGRYTGSYYPQRSFQKESAAKLWLIEHCCEWLEKQRS